MSSDALSRIEEHLAAVATLSLTDEAPLPEPPDLGGLTIADEDLDRARDLLRAIAAAEQRLAGLRVRVRGEIESARRPRPDLPAPAPRVLDTSA